MKFNPAKYLREVRQEVSKVTWPSKRETFTSAGIVLVVISIAAIILMLLDQFFSYCENSFRLIQWLKVQTLQNGMLYIVILGLKKK
jgi:preprotein translocase subunit SecE